MLGGSQPGSQMDTVLMNILNRNKHDHYDTPLLHMTIAQCDGFFNPQMDNNILLLLQH